MTNKTTEDMFSKPLNLIDNDLALNENLDVYSNSRLQTFLTNPREYKHKYIDKLMPLGDKPYFLFGKVYHLMLEHKNEEQVRKIIENDNEYLDSTLDDKELIVEQAIILGDGALTAFTFFKGWHETTFLVPLTENTALKGVIDYIYYNENGEVGIGEWKTTSSESKITNKLNFITQVHTYAYAYFLATGEKPVEFTYKIATKPLVRQKANESREEYLGRYRSKTFELNEDNKFTAFTSITQKLDWNKVEEIWEGNKEIVKMIEACKVFPINDYVATLYGKWDYDVLYDPQVKNPELFFKDKPEIVDEKGGE